MYAYQSTMFLLDEVRSIIQYSSHSTLRLYTEKYLQAAKALLKAQSLDTKDPGLHVRIVDFKQRRMYFRATSCCP